MNDQPVRPPTDWREGRRLRAWELAEQGWKQKDSAAALGVSQGAVSQWLSRARAAGPTALRRQPPPGRRPRLTAAQRAQTPGLLARGPAAWRFRGDVWTRNRSALVIKEVFGVAYDPSQIGRIMRAVRHSPQKLVRRARQRQEARITQWRETAAPALKKKALAEGATLVFVDETGCYLLPAVARTYAPMGQTPILPHTLTRDHRSLIGGLTLEGRLLLQSQERAFRSTDVVRFLKHLFHHIVGKLLIVWDGASIHFGAVKTFLRSSAARRITLARLPSYAPELNPVEGVWHDLKQVELANVCCHDLTELRQEVRKAVARIRHRANGLAGCIRQPGCY